MNREVKKNWKGHVVCMFGASAQPVHTYIDVHIHVNIHTCACVYIRIYMHADKHVGA
jgi:hypothetical protein